MQQSIEKLIETYKAYTACGNVANYIPELGKANPTDFGVCVYTMDGQSYCAGDFEKPFTIQSVSKPLVLLLALMDHGEEVVFQHVGKEPTGDPFNSIVRLETFDEHQPFNPMINAGAIAVASLIKGDSVDHRFERILDMLRKITGNNNIGMNESVYKSEMQTGNRNRSMGYFMKDVGIIKGDVEEVLDLYFRQCSIEMTCKDIAAAALTLANHGKSVETGEELIPRRYARIATTFMMTCGMYDASGEFALDVGIPAKSGVGGGILAAVPGKMGIGVYGPALDEKGNSVWGTRLLTDLSKEYDLSLF